jgi:RimJ/RimL family protein N-acetyltransferase
MSWIAHEPLDATKRLQLIETWERDWTEGGDVVLGVRAGDRILGGCGLHRRCGPNGLEIGYWVDKDHLHQGIGTEIARLLTAAALGVAGVTFAEIHHDRANVVSGRIPQRLGYVLIEEKPDEVEAPAEIGIDCIWRMKAADWPPLEEPNLGGKGLELGEPPGKRPFRPDQRW